MWDLPLKSSSIGVPPNRIPCDLCRYLVLHKRNQRANHHRHGANAVLPTRLHHCQGGEQIKETNGQRTNANSVQ